MAASGLVERDLRVMDIQGGTIPEAKHDPGHSPKYRLWPLVAIKYNSDGTSRFLGC